MRFQFLGHSKPSIGLGTELQLIDAKTALPIPKASEIIASLQDSRVQVGIFESVIEIDSNLHSTVCSAVGELRELTENLRKKCNPLGLTLLSAGSHPMVRWETLTIADNPSRRKLLDRLKWVGERMAIFGLRIHIGVPDAEKAIAIGNSLRGMIPLFVALSASSPYWNGYDTKLASVRSRIIENVPNAGIPPKFINWAEFVRFVKTLRSAEAIHDFSEIWWDIRPSLSRGTVRIQVCDTPHTFREMAILASVAYASVHTLLHYYREGERMLEHGHFIVRENKWRVSRFGLDAKLLISSEGKVKHLREVLDMTLEKILATSKKLGCEEHIHEVEEILGYGPGYVRQRTMHKQMNPREATLAIAKEFETDELIF